LELIEEAVHALRSASAATLASYYTGTVPFVMGFLYFWTDMSRSPFASRHVAEAALAMAGLFLWMKLCQAYFSQRIRAQVANKPMPSWTARQATQVFISQAMIQPTGLFLIPFSLILTIPFGSVYAFYQSVTALGDPDAGPPAMLARKAWKHSWQWPRQNHIVLAALFAFGFVVFLNWFLVSLSIPRLLKMLFGIESIFTQSGSAILNTTFFAVIMGVTYLTMDPIVKTVYALRCFYSDSLQSGEDLKANLKQFALTPAKFVAGLLLMIAVAYSIALAQESAPVVSPPALDKQIDQVIHQDKYAWRLPRTDVVDEGEKGIVSRFMDGVGNMMRRALRASLNWIGEALREWFKDRINRQGNGAASWITSSLLLYLLMGIVFTALLVFFVRVWRDRNRRVVPVRAEAIAYQPDLADENVGADQLPVDGWMQLAQSLLKEGNFRLALRALYLSTLAHLSQRNLIALATFKSNREYESELRRRGHAFPELSPIFAENVSFFERIWYGAHEATEQSVYQFAENVERITGSAWRL